VSGAKGKDGGSVRMDIFWERMLVAIITPILAGLVLYAFINLYFIIRKISKEEEERKKRSLNPF
jgi:hypothetical protein